MTTRDLPTSLSDLQRENAELSRRLDSLAESEASHRSLANAARQIMMVALPTGEAVFWNDHFLSYTGLRLEDATGLNWAQVVHPDDLPELMRRREAAIPAGVEYEFRARFRRHDGAYRWHMGRTVPVKIDGRLQSWVGTAAEVHDLVETERALRDSETRFKLMSDAIPQLVWIALPTGSVEFFNSRWHAYTGLSADDARGEGWQKVIHPDDVPVTMAAWKKSTDLGAPFSVAERLRGADGHYRWFLAQAMPLLDEAGQVARWYGTCTDIEDQKKFQEESEQTRERLNFALEAGRMGAWDVDLIGEQITWSPSLSLLYGIDPAVTAGPMRALEVYVHSDDLDAGRRVIAEAVESKKPFRFEFRIVRADGGVRWLEARGRVIVEGGRATRLAGVSVDITERKETDKELARRADELARSNKELEQFAFVASHDLKEPLRKIAGYAELIQSRYQSKLDEKGERFLTYLQDGVMRMDAIIGDLLTYSRAGRGGRERSAVDTAAVVSELLDDLETALNDVQAKVAVGDLPVVYADRTQIRQVIQNLVVNALKFRGKALPEISISAVKDRDAWHFTVKDNGIGIDPQYFDRIFEIFQRLHTRTEYPGTGIGLAICKKIVESQGGRIWVESAPGAGAAFHFTLPAF